MLIRKFTEADRTSVIELWHESGLTRPWNNPDKDITRKQAFQPDLFLVGELDGEVIASAMAGYDGHRGSVFYLAVTPRLQKAGYGQLLMKEVESLLVSIGCPKLNILIRSTNTDVIKFYDSIDYGIDDVVSVGKRLIPDI